MFYQLPLSLVLNEDVCAGAGASQAGAEEEGEVEDSSGARAATHARVSASTAMHLSVTERFSGSTRYY